MRFECYLALSLSLGGCVSDNIWTDSVYETSYAYKRPADDLQLLGTYYSKINSTLFVSYDNSTGAATFQAQAINLPEDRRYLYLRQSPVIYSDTATLKTDAYGMLSSADVNSQQDIGTALCGRCEHRRIRGRPLCAPAQARRLHCIQCDRTELSALKSGAPIHLACNVYARVDFDNTEDATPSLSSCTDADFRAFASINRRRSKSPSMIKSMASWLLLRS